MRKQHEESNSPDDITSTQNMIEDARARKASKIDKKCDQCDFSTASKAMLRLHVRTKHRINEKQREDREEVNTLSASKASTSDVSAENNLTNAKTYIKKRIKCDHCDKKFNKQERFKLHMETVHKGSKRDKCDKCDKTFNNKNALREHEKTVHLELATDVG